MANQKDLDHSLFGQRVRLSSIEAFHLFSSSEAWPNCVTSRHRFKGEIDIVLAKQAWQHCLARQHHSNWSIQGRSRKVWHTNPESLKPIAEVADNSFHELVLDAWPDSETEIELAGVNERGLPQIDIESESSTGFGLWCIRSRSDDRVCILFAAHHTLADGVSGMGFVRQWMMAYHNLCCGEEIERGLPKLDWQRWQSRSKLGLLKWSFLKYLPCQVIGLFGASKFIFRKFSTIEATDSNCDRAGSPGITGRSFSPQMVAELKERSQRLNVSTNSLLMTILFRAFKRIERQMSGGDFERCRWAERKWIRLILPIGTRSLADRKLPCANKASIVQIERTFDQVSDADVASQSIEREVRIIVGFKLEQIFLILIKAASLFPWLLRRISTDPKSRGTAVFTNLGEPFRKTRSCNFRELGNLKLVDFDICGPIRSGTPLNVIWSQFRGSTGSTDSVAEPNAIHGRLSVHFDRSLFSTQEADLILDALEHELIDVTQFGG